MLQGSHPNSHVCILAAVVLYRRKPSESESLCSLIQILNANPDLGKHFSIAIYDSSPQRHNSTVAVDLQALFPLDVRREQFKTLKLAFRCHFKKPVETLQTALVDGAHFFTLHAVWHACQA